MNTNYSRNDDMKDTALKLMIGIVTGLMIVGFIIVFTAIQKGVAEDIIKDRKIKSGTSNPSEILENDKKILKDVLPHALPVNATNIVVLDGKWFTFQVGENKFMGQAYVFRNSIKIQTITSYTE